MLENFAFPEKHEILPHRFPTPGNNCALHSEALSATVPVMSAALDKLPSVRVLLDGHVHVYPLYALDAFFAAAIRNMPRQQASDIRVLCLAERHDCSFFEQLSQDDVRLPTGWTIAEWDPDGAVGLTHADGHKLWICAGRQIATRERIEICSLFSDVRIQDGLDVHSTLAQISETHALAALNFAPGKWMGKRGRILTALLKQHRQADIVAVDTTLRPVGWPTPSILKICQKRQWPILAGSDPLPFRGEEKRAGQFFAAFQIPPPREGRLVEALKTALQNRATQLSHGGARDSWPTVIQRIRQNSRSKST